MTSTVTVRGFAVVRAKPDEAELHLELSALEVRSDDAFTEVARRSEQLASILDTIGIPADKRLTSSVSVRPEGKYVKDDWVHRGYRALTTVTVRLADLSLIGRVMNDSIENVGAEVSGPSWRVALDNPARAAACREAAADAKRKAQAYASSLGVRLGVVVEVIEPGLRREPEVRAAYMAVQDASAPAPGMHVDSGELDIGAAVEVTFRLES